MIQFNQQISCLDLHFIVLCVGRDTLNFDGVPTQSTHHVIGRVRITLLLRDQIGIGRFLSPLLQGIDTLLVIVGQKHLAILCHHLQGSDDPCLHIVGVITHRPGHFLGGRRGSVPLPAGHVLAGKSHIADITLHSVGAAIAKGFVKSTHTVVIIRRPQHITGIPAGVVTPGPDPFQAEACEPRNFIVGEQLPLAYGNRTNTFVIGTGAAGHIQQWHRLMQIQANSRLPVVYTVNIVAGDILAYRNAIAVIVMIGVVPPKRHTARWHVEVVGVALDIAPVPLNLACPAVDLEYRCDQGNHLLPNLGEGLSGFHCQSVGQFHHHLWRT